MRKLNGLLKMQKLTESSEMVKIEITVDIYPHNHTVDGNTVPMTVVDASAVVANEVIVARKTLIDEIIESLEGITKDDVIAAAKREVLRELTVNLVANGVL
ncbi:hypothetical protein RCIP0053_00023 [Klebsiella phage RCIP0053]